MVDVVIIGAGVAGSATARELSRYNVSILVLERGHDVACGASRTNSAIIHGGYDPVPGTRKALYNVQGMRMLPELSAQLGFRYRNNGSLVVAFCEEEIPILQKLLERGMRNGLDSCSIIYAEELHTLEPHLAGEAVAALFCSEAGIVDPFGMTLAYAENAVVNGAEFTFNKEVTCIEKLPRKASDGARYVVKTQDGTTLRCGAVVNAAGCYADVFNTMVSDTQFAIAPRLGEYCVFERGMASAFAHVMFQCPSELGKGILITPTIEGNLLVGPDSIEVNNCEDCSTSAAGLIDILEKGKKTWPELDTSKIINNFAGIRPYGADHDFVLGQPADAPGFFNIGAFDSPGLTSAPAVAVTIAQDVAAYLGALVRQNFQPYRAQPSRFIEMDEEKVDQAIENNPQFGKILCRCEQVTEAEVVAAIHAPIPALDVDAIRRRTRTSTGACQGGFCTPRVMEVIARETGIPLQDVLLGGYGSEIAPLRHGQLMFSQNAQAGLEGSNE